MLGSGLAVVVVGEACMTLGILLDLHKWSSSTGDMVNASYSLSVLVGNLYLRYYRDGPVAWIVVVAAGSSDWMPVEGKK